MDEQSKSGAAITSMTEAWDDDVMRWSWIIVMLAVAYLVVVARTFRPR